MGPGQFYRGSFLDTSKLLVLRSVKLFVFNSSHLPSGVPFCWCVVSWHLKTGWFFTRTPGTSQDHGQAAGWLKQQVKTSINSTMVFVWRGFSCKNDCRWEEYIQTGECMKILGEDFSWLARTDFLDSEKGYQILRFLCLRWKRLM